mgnify:CR=1 FL=1
MNKTFYYYFLYFARILLVFPVFLYANRKFIELHLDFYGLFKTFNDINKKVNLKFHVTFSITSSSKL